MLISWTGDSPSMARVASLWSVNEESTSLFMESFYRGPKAVFIKAEVPRRARLESMQRQIKSAVTGEQESLASPCSRAFSVLIGDWNSSCSSNNTSSQGLGHSGGGRTQLKRIFQTRTPVFSRLPLF